MATTAFDRDNLGTATKPLVTADDLQLESGQNVTRGTVLKKGTTGLVVLASTTDTPYCVALQNIDATSAAKDITYTYDGSMVASELTFTVGAIADFRDAFVASTRLLIEE